ncbi:MAG: amidohydrolase [Candidatus Izemoplasma sp.]|nr:amidohydrolase [Candidatus Izemoplasma sp.]
MKELKKFRRDLHQIPELSLQEQKTSSYLKQALEDMGYQPFSLLETDVLVFIDASSEETIAFRSDIDALPVNEETGLDFKSKHPGNMHACGHDGHMSMLLGLAKYLSSKKSQLKKNILLIFQPAEESIGGAKLLCDTGFLDKYNVKAIFGIHLYPEIDEGILASKPNEFMAMASEVTITVNGKSAHGAMPHLGVDANLILSKLLIDFQTIQTRQLSPLEYSIITFGKIGGGTVRNAVSDYAFMEGTIRAFSVDTFQTIKSSIRQLCKQYEISYDCQIDVAITEGYLPVINDPILYKRWQNATSSFETYTFEKPLMIAEDFSFYQDNVPGVFFYVGTKNTSLGYTHSLHHPKFNFDETVLETGLKAYQAVLKEMEVLNE